MSINDALGSWQQVGTQVALTTSIAGTAALELILHDETKSLWPAPSRQVVRRNLAAGGGPMPLKKNIVLGRTAPAGQMRLPLTPIGMALAYQSLLQDTTYSSTKYTLGLPSLTRAAYFMMLENGIAGEQGIMRSVGTVVTQVGLSVPPVTDSDPGDVMLTCPIIGASGDEASAFSSGSPATDTATPLTSRDASFTIGGSAKPLISAEVNIGNSGRKSGNVGSTPDAIFVGPYTIEGNVKVYQTSANADVYDQLLDAHKALTELKFGISFTGGHKVEWGAIPTAPTYSDEEDMRVVSFGFMPVMDNDYLLVEVTTSNLNW